MAKNQTIDEEVSEDETIENVEEVEEETEEVESETTETEPEGEEPETESEEETEPEEDEEPEPEKETEKEPEKPNKATSKTAKKKPVKKKPDEDETDAELDAFFEKLRKQKERQQLTTKAKKDGEEKTFTQAEFEKALKSALAKRLPSKEEREQFEHWKESQQTMEEKVSALTVKNSRLEEELESLKHENTIIRAGVDKDAIEFVQYKVERMDGDFDDNLQDFLKEHKKYMTPKPQTTIVEAAEHKPKVKTGITKKELDKMGYVERAKFREEHPDEYAKAMGR